MLRSKRDYNDSNPIIEIGELIFNLLILNVLWIICSIPIVTTGASATALNYTCIKMRRDEGDSIVKMFFRSFSQNIRQAVILTTVMLIILIILLGGLIQVLGIVNAGNLWAVVWLVLLVILLLIWMILYTYIFMVLARFDNTIRRTLINAAYFAVTDLRSTLMILSLETLTIIVLPTLLWTYVPYLFPMVIFFDMSFTTYMNAKVFDQMFERYMPGEKKSNKAQTYKKQAK